MAGRPLVVISGWMGSQQRHLRRYAEVYQKLGFSVLPVTATPAVICESTFTPGIIQTPTMWPYGQSNVHENHEFLQGLAWDILSVVEHEKPQAVVFQAMSNGGCFVWEQLRNILDSYDTCPDPYAAATLQSIKEDTIRGVVFDSSPAWFGDRLNVFGPALEYASDEAKQEVFERFDKDLFYEKEPEKVRNQRVSRNKEYFQFLIEDPLDIPQLFMYSKNDALTDYTKIKEIVDARVATRNGPVMEVCWEESAHCAHLLHHPEEYTQAVENLVNLATK
eukprot:Nitzschia sp. Nitz4//scaffold3_size479765//11859//12689//NITZ4_000008-RA/size479765-processed-gene-0.233-mRNA-1//1//CDS//3329550482//3439//frame0